VIVKENRYKNVNEDWLSKYCENTLRKYLNYTNYQEAMEEETEFFESPDGIDVPITVLKAAHKNDFTYIREVKILKQKIYQAGKLLKDPSFFEAPPNTLPCLNGFYNLDTGLFSPYDGKKPVMNQINARYVEEYANSDLPSLFTSLLFNGLDDQSLYMRAGRGVTQQRVENLIDILSYSFLPGNPMRKFFMILGPTKSGKSTLVNIMREIFGDYGITLNSHSLMKRQGGYDQELRGDLYDAVDKLWIDVSEIDKSQCLDPVLVKTFTGGDKINLRRAYSRNRVSKSMNGKIFIVSNFFPRVLNPEDAALHDRLVVIDWHNTVDERNVDEHLFSKLTTNEMRSRIFSHLIKRAGKMQKGGLTIHPSFRFTTTGYFLGQNDLVAKFYDEIVIKVGPSAVCYSIWGIHYCYTAFLANMGIKEVPNIRVFSMDFARIVRTDATNMVQKLHTKSGNFYTGMQFHLAYANLVPVTFLYEVCPSYQYGQAAPREEKNKYVFKNQRDLHR
jgi:phage/plasmid-associated DNA primase